MENGLILWLDNHMDIMFIGLHPKQPNQVANIQLTDASLPRGYLLERIPWREKPNDLLTDWEQVNPNWVKSTLGVTEIIAQF